MSDFEEDFYENRENIDPRNQRDFVSSRPIKMPYRNGSAAGESDSGYDLTSESSPPTAGLGPSDSEAGPDTADEEFRPANEIFKDPNAFDFLSQHGHGSTSAAALARESLYTKFDPLIAGRASIMPPRVSQHGGRQESNEGDLIAMNSPSPQKPVSRKKKGSSVIVLNAEPDYSSTANGLGSSPTQEENDQEENKRDRRLHSNNNHNNNNNNVHQESAQDSLSRETRELEQRQYLQFQEKMLKKDAQMVELDQVMRSMRNELDAMKREVRLRQGSEEQMKQVLTEYEKTISELIADKQREQQSFEEEKIRLATERDQALDDLKNVESAFADVHRKYERTKQAVEAFKQNEDQLKECLDGYASKLKKAEEKFELLKEHAEETLEKANKEIENVTRSQDSEIARLTAILKKTEAKTSSLERSIDQKVKENEELSAICDELIAKVGNS